MEKLRSRVVAHLAVTDELDSSEIDRSRALITQWCKANGHTLVDIFVSTDKDKRYPHDYPAVLCMLNSGADALLVMRSAAYSRRPSNDLLEQLCLTQEASMTLVSPEQMQKLNLWVLPGPWDQQVPEAALDLSGPIRAH